MTNSIAKIRAALEQACEYIRSDLASERGAFEGHEGVSRIDEIKADLASNASALAALAELEQAASEPVAWMYDKGDEEGLVTPFNPLTTPGHGGRKNIRPLYAAPPAPIAEIREPTPEECERICTEYERLLMREGTCGGRDAFDAVKDVMWPKEGES